MKGEKPKKNEGRIESYKFFNKESLVEEYSRMYGTPTFDKGYPANRQRLSIIMSLLKNIKPENLVDAGCGSGMPLVEMLSLGFDAIGYDKSTNMVNQAKINLEKNNFASNRVTLGDFQNPKHLQDNSFECITGMGAFYYGDDILEILNNQRRKLVNGGHLIFSLRNRLFDLVTLNEYTVKFLAELFEIKEYDNNIQEMFERLFLKGKEIKKRKKKNIDDHGVISKVHNPLTIKQEILDPVELSLKEIYFYHYHALPPSFEGFMPQEFRTNSWKIEDPTDWRGYFLASCFIVHCIKE